MKCPYCGYEDGELDDDRDKGQFWFLSNDVKLERRYGFLETQEADLAGCPSCKKLFVDD